MLKTDSITVRFSGLTAVDHVSMEITSDKLVAIIGPNGAGKTTLFNLITGFLPPTEGRVFFNHKDITGWKPHQITNNGLCRTFQITKLFEQLTVLDNVLVGSLWYEKSISAAREVAWEALAKVGLLDIAQQTASGLPIGHRKRLELARVLATQPKMVLLDEVMGGLTPQEVGEMSEVLAGIFDGGIGVVMIEHIMSAVMALSHRIFVLNQGKLIAVGSPEEIRNNDVVLEAYLGKHFARAKAKQAEMAAQ